MVFKIWIFQVSLPIPIFQINYYLIFRVYSHVFHQFFITLNYILARGAAALAKTQNYYLEWHLKELQLA